MKIEIKVGAYKIVIEQDKTETWFATCDGFFNRLELDAKTIKEAEREGLRELQAALEGVLAEVEMRLTRF